MSKKENCIEDVDGREAFCRDIAREMTIRITTWPSFIVDSQTAGAMAKEQGVGTKANKWLEP